MSLESASERERERERERGMGTGREWAPGKGREKATVWAPDRWGPGGEDPG
ncbi:MAG: hypothetical protein ACRDJG_10170 [Actinomycetota bacterium]